MTDNTAAKTENAPLVSVIIPTYNRARLVAKAVESVLAQTCKDHEIIVVDDGSTDDTEAALSVFSGKIKYVRQPNAGVSSARNRGVAEAGGRYLAFLDSDDTWHPDKLACQSAALERAGEDCQFSFTDVSLLQDGAPRISHFASEGYIPPSREEFVIDRPLSVLASQKFGEFVMPKIQAVMMTRRLFRQVGGFNVLLSSGEDYELFFRCSRLTKFCCLNRILANVEWTWLDCVSDRVSLTNLDREAKLSRQTRYLEYLLAWWETEHPRAERTERRDMGRYLRRQLTILAGEHIALKNYGEARRKLWRSLFCGLSLPGLLRVLAVSICPQLYRFHSLRRAGSRTN